MDLTEVKFITRLSGNASYPFISMQILGYFTSIEAAEQVLKSKHGWEHLNGTFNYRQFLIEDIVVGAIFMNNKGISKRKVFDVTPSGLVEVENDDSQNKVSV